VRPPRYVAVALAATLETLGNASTSERAEGFRARLSRVEHVVRGPDGRAKFTVFHSREPF